MLINGPCVSSGLLTQLSSPVAIRVRSMQLRITKEPSQVYTLANLGSLTYREDQGLDAGQASDLYDFVGTRPIDLDFWWDQG
jgi:hypothetical protein